MCLRESWSRPSRAQFSRAGPAPVQNLQGTFGDAPEVEETKTTRLESFPAPGDRQDIDWVRKWLDRGAEPSFGPRRRRKWRSGVAREMLWIQYRDKSPVTASH